MAKKRASKSASVSKPGRCRPFCRLVLIPEGTNTFHYGPWLPESEEIRITAVMEQWNSEQPQRATACVQYFDPIAPESGPRHWPALNALPGQKVVRFKFPGGDTADIAKDEFHEHEARQLRRLIHAHERRAEDQRREGRALGVKKRLERAAARRAVFDAEVRKLLRNNKRSTAAEICAYMAQEMLTPYKQSSTLRYIESIKAALRKNG